MGARSLLQTGREAAKGTINGSFNSRLSKMPRLILFSASLRLFFVLAGEIKTRRQPCEKQLPKILHAVKFC